MNSPTKKLLEWSVAIVLIPAVLLGLVWAVSSFNRPSKPTPPIAPIVQPQPKLTQPERYSLAIIETMQKDATKINWYSKRLKNSAEQAFIQKSFEDLAKVDNEINQLENSIETDRGNIAKAFQVCDDNLFMDLGNYTYVMREVLAGSKDAQADLPQVKQDYEKSYEQCTDIIYRATAQQIYDKQ